jgi:alginate O-acetyltransferase complex protein AlgI
MVFSSNLFLFGFLPLILILYFLTPNRFRNILLFRKQSVFLTCGDADQLFFVFIGCVVLNHYCGSLDP